jgi:hypothetical protein
MMRTKLRLPEFPEATIPLALLALSVIGFVPMVYRLGFFWDDWPSIWFFHLWGPGSFLESFSIDRPSLAWMFMLTTSVFGESTAGWQFFAVAARWLASLVFWWTLRGLWPRQAAQAFWAAALFLIYPGFGQQYIAVTYSNAFMVFSLFLFSLGSMIWACRRPAWFWPLTALALIAQLVSMSMTEYFFGLELLRPALLWLTLAKPGDEAWQRLRQVMLRWLPYASVAAFFLIDRLFFHQTPRGRVILLDQLSADPFRTLARTIATIVNDFIEVNFAAWFSGFDLGFLRSFEANIIWIFFAIVVGCFLFILVYSARMNPTAARTEGAPRTEIKAWGWQAAGLGIYAFLASGWIIWVTDLHIELIFPWDRFTLITLTGTSLLIAGLIAALTRNRLQSAIVLGVLIGSSAGLQFQHRLQYRQEWLAQRNFFWQLSWRAPEIEPGTTLLTSELPFTYYSDNSLTAPLNWTYAPEHQERQMSYLLYDIEARLGLNGASIKNGAPIRMNYRAASFEGSTDQAIVVFYEPPRCVKVLDPQVDRFLPVKPLYIREALPLSRPELIHASSGLAAAPPEHILGPEPPHRWCYYFEKAELYGQMGEWHKAAQAADQALQVNKTFTQKNISELMPFIEAYAHIGEWTKAVKYSIQSYQVWEKTQYPLCDVWMRILASTPASEERQAALNQIQEALNCRFP